MGTLRRCPDDAPNGRDTRIQVKVLLTPEARRMLKTLALHRKLPMEEYLEALIRDLYGKG
jgi:hypothetical protein